MRKATFVSVVLILSVIAASPAVGQASAPDGWKFTVAPYIFGAGMNGTTAIAGQEIDVDMSFSDVLSNLQFGAMGMVVARKGSWGMGGDAIWMALGGNGSSPAPTSPAASGTRRLRASPRQPGSREGEVTREDRWTSRSMVRMRGSICSVRERPGTRTPTGNLRGVRRAVKLGLLLPLFTVLGVLQWRHRGDAIQSGVSTQGCG